jgi:Fe2+ transport system protein FeoA
MGMMLGKVQGILQELSAEELARQQGLSAAPPTPLGTQGIGGSQDVAKMAGTPNQIRAMVQDSLMERTRTRDLMGESQRTNGRARYSVESLQEKMNVLEGLGSLEGRIPEYVRTQLKTAQTVSVPNTTNAQAVTQHLASLGITDKASIDKAVAAVDKVRAAGASPADVSAALAALKIEATITDGTTALAGKLAPFFTQADIQTVQNQMATILQDYSAVKMKDLPDQLAQFANPQNNVNDVAAILGLTDEQLGNMTLGEVQSQLKAWKSRNFQDVEILRDVLQDPSYSMAEKDFARQRLAEMGAVGVTSIEEKTNNLEAQVAEGDTVVVGGQAVKVSELMSDPKLKAIISTALSSDEELAKLEKTDKDLASWISRNKAALVPLQNELLTGTAKFAENNKVFADNMGDLVATHKTFMDKVIPGWNTAKDVAWKDWLGSPAAGDVAATGLYATAPTMAHVLTIPDKAKRSVALSALSKLPVEQAKNFSTTFLDQITAAAKDDTEAGQLMESFLATEDKDWIAGITPTANLKLDPTSLYDEDYKEEDYNKAVSEIVRSFDSGFNSLKELTDKINALRTGGPKDREEARRLSGVLADIKRQVNQTINKDTIDRVKAQNKTTKQKNTYLDSVKIADKSLETIYNVIKNNKTLVGQNSATVLANTKSAIDTLRLQASEGSISYTEAQTKLKEIETNLAKSMLSTMVNKGDRVAYPGLIDLAATIRDTKLLNNLNPQERKSLREQVEQAKNAMPSYQGRISKEEIARYRNLANDIIRTIDTM